MAFSGELISINPTTIKAGLPINLVVTYKVTTNSPVEIINGWTARIELTLDGLEGAAETEYIFGWSRTVKHTVNLGPDVMPGYDLNGYAKIICYKGGFSGYAEVVYYEPIVIHSSYVPDGGNGELPSGKFPIIPLAIAGGAIVVAAAFLTKKK